VIIEDKKCEDPDTMYRCANNRCIYQRWLCDGEDDCRSGELDDEDPKTCTSEFSLKLGAFVLWYRNEFNA
jgi:hypothetical protein